MIIITSHYSNFNFDINSHHNSYPIIVSGAVMSTNISNSLYVIITGIANK